MKIEHRILKILLVAVVAGLLMLTSGLPALAGDQTDLWPAESTWWRAQLGRSAQPTAFMQIGGQGLEQGPGEFGGAAESGAGGPSNLKEKFTAGLLSAVLPGAGQFYNGNRQKAYIMGGIEVGIWTAWFVFDTQGDNRMSDARDFAGIYAGTSGGHDDNYWQSVARYMDSDAYNEDRYREARALQEPVSGLVGAQEAWQWVNADRMFGYRQMRADAASAYDRRDFMILFAVLNRAVSVFDAVRGAGRDEPVSGTQVMGMNLRVEFDPFTPSPEARAVVTRGF